MTEPFIPSYDGYQNMVSYRKAQIVFDATVSFCGRFIDKRDRANGRMVRAARAAKQHLVEGSMASGTSKETEIQLTGAALSNLEDLLEDYRNFLRTRGLEEWTQDHPYTLHLRQLNRSPNATFETFRRGIENPDPAIGANVIIGLIQVTAYLLDREIQSLEQAIVQEEGGLRERMTRVAS